MNEKVRKTMWVPSKIRIHSFYSRKLLKLNIFTIVFKQKEKA